MRTLILLVCLLLAVLALPGSAQAWPGGYCEEAVQVDCVSQGGWPTRYCQVYLEAADFKVCIGSDDVD